jgi:hypothetical protein
MASVSPDVARGLVFEQRRRLPADVIVGEAAARNAELIVMQPDRLLFPLRSVAGNALGTAPYRLCPSHPQPRILGSPSAGAAARWHPDKRAGDCPGGRHRFSGRRRTCRASRVDASLQAPDRAWHFCDTALSRPAAARLAAMGVGFHRPRAQLRPCEIVADPAVTLVFLSAPITPS